MINSFLSNVGSRQVATDQSADRPAHSKTAHSKNLRARKIVQGVNMWPLFGN
jgi:hypothetical protein